MSGKSRRTSGVLIFQKSLNALKSCRPHLNNNVLIKGKDATTERDVNISDSVRSMSHQEYRHPPRRGHGRHSYAKNRRCKSECLDSEKLGHGDAGTNSQSLVSEGFIGKDIVETQRITIHSVQEKEPEHSLEDDWSNDLIDIEVATENTETEVHIDQREERESENTTDADHAAVKGGNESSEGEINVIEFIKHLSESGRDEPEGIGPLQSTPKKISKNIDGRGSKSCSSETVNNDRKQSVIEENSSQYLTQLELKEGKNVDIQELKDGTESEDRIPKATDTVKVLNDTSFQTEDTRPIKAFNKTNFTAEFARESNRADGRSKDECVEGSSNDSNFTNVHVHIKCKDDKYESVDKKVRPLTEKGNYVRNSRSAEIEGRHPCTGGKKHCNNHPLKKTGFVGWEYQPCPPRFQSQERNPMFRIHSTPKYRDSYYRGKGQKSYYTFRENFRNSFERPVDTSVHTKGCDGRNHDWIRPSSEDWDSEIDNYEEQLCDNMNSVVKERGADIMVVNENAVDTIFLRRETIEETNKKHDLDNQAEAQMECLITCINEPYLPPPPPSDDENDQEVLISKVNVGEEIGEVHISTASSIRGSESANASAEGVRKSFEELDINQHCAVDIPNRSLFPNTDKREDSTPSAVDLVHSRSARCSSIHSDMAEAVDSDSQGASSRHGQSMLNDLTDMYSTDISDIAVMSQDEYTCRKKRSCLGSKRVTASSDISCRDLSDSYHENGNRYMKDHEIDNQYMNPWLPYCMDDGYREWYYMNMWKHYDWYNYWYGNVGRYEKQEFPGAYDAPPSYSWKTTDERNLFSAEISRSQSMYAGMSDYRQDGASQWMYFHDTNSPELPQHENIQCDAMVTKRKNSSRKTTDKLNNVQSRKSKMNSAEIDQTHSKISNKEVDMVKSDQSANVKASVEQVAAKTEPDREQTGSSVTCDRNKGPGTQSKNSQCLCKDAQVQYLVWRVCKCPEGTPPRLEKIYQGGQGERSLDLGYQSYDSIEEVGSRCSLKPVSHKAIPEDLCPPPGFQSLVYPVTSSSGPSDSSIPNSLHQPNSASSFQKYQSISQRMQQAEVMDNMNCMYSIQGPAELTDNNVSKKNVVQVTDDKDINNNMPKSSLSTPNNDEPISYPDKSVVRNINVVHSRDLEEEDSEEYSPANDSEYLELPSDFTKSASHLAAASASLHKAGLTDKDLNTALHTFSEAIMAIGKTLKANKIDTDQLETKQENEEACTRRETEISKQAKIGGRNTAEPESHDTATGESLRKVFLTYKEKINEDIKGNDNSKDVIFISDSQAGEADSESCVSEDDRVKHVKTKSSGLGLDWNDGNNMQPLEKNENEHETKVRDNTKSILPVISESRQKSSDKSNSQQQTFDIRRPFIPSEYRPRSHFLNSPPLPRFRPSAGPGNFFPGYLYDGGPRSCGPLPEPPFYPSEMYYPNPYEPYSNRANRSEFGTPPAWGVGLYPDRTDTKRKHNEPDMAFPREMGTRNQEQSGRSLNVTHKSKAELMKDKCEKANTSINLVEYCSSDDTSSDSEMDSCHDHRNVMARKATLGKHVAKKMRSDSSDYSEREFSEESVEKEKTELQTKTVLGQTINCSTFRSRPPRQKVLKSFTAPDEPKAKLHSPSFSEFCKKKTLAEMLTGKCKTESPNTVRESTESVRPTQPSPLLTPSPGAAPLPPLPPFPVSPFWGMYLPKNNSALLPSDPQEKSYSAAAQTGVDSDPQSTRVQEKRYMRRSWPVSFRAQHYTQSTSESDSDIRSPGLRNWRQTFKEFHSFGVKYIDTHCHLDFLFNRDGFHGNLQDYMAAHPETFPDTFEGCVAVFCNPSSFNPKHGLWCEVAKEDNVWIAMGCHPKMVMDFTEMAEDGLRKCMKHKKCIALGEIGLDYSGWFWQQKELQKKVFKVQLRMAMELNKPLVIHCRKAEQDCLEILKEIVPKDHKIHCHCFTESYANAKLWTDAFPNLYIGITPLVTYDTATPCHDLARKIPLNRLLLETDCTVLRTKMYSQERHEPVQPRCGCHSGQGSCQASGVASGGGATSV